MRLNRVGHLLTPFGGPPPAGLEESLRSRFLGAAALSAASNVWANGSAPGQAYPQIIVSLLRETPDNVRSLESVPAWAELQVAVVDDDPARGRSLRDAAWRSLAPLLNPPLAFAGGKDTGGRVPGPLWQIKQPDGRNGSGAWAFYFSYMLYLERPLT